MFVCGPGNIMVKIVAVSSTGTYSTCVIVQVLSTTSLHLTYSVPYAYGYSADPVGYLHNNHCWLAA